MEVDLETQLLSWILEEHQRLTAAEKAPAVPIHLLLIKLALANRAEDPALTMSTKLSLEIFDRAAAFRHLRALSKRGLLYFTDATGEEYVPGDKEFGDAASGEKTQINFVRLSDEGINEAGSRVGNAFPEE